MDIKELTSLNVMSEDMASMNSYTNIGAHLKKVSDTFSEDTSMSEILDQFRVMSAEYQAFTKDRSIRVSTGPADYRIADEDDKLKGTSSDGGLSCH